MFKDYQVVENLKESAKFIKYLIGPTYRNNKKPEMKLELACVSTIFDFERFVNTEVVESEASKL